MGRFDWFASFDGRCEALPPGRIEVSATPIRFTEDAGQSYRMLTQMKDAAGRGHRTVGLTQATLGYESTLESHGIEDRRHGRVCARPSVDVVFAAAPMTVYVAREFADDPCRRAAIRDHEMKHVAVYRDYLEVVVARMRQELPAMFGTQVVNADNAKASEEAMRHRMHAFMATFMKASYAELRARQEEVDSEEEYARLSRGSSALLPA